MKHNYANGRGTPFPRPIYKSRYLSDFRKSGLVTLLICLFSFHFVSFAQESRESGMTGIGVEERGHKIVPYSVTNLIEKTRNSGLYDLELYPWETYDIDSSIIIKIKVGDSIPPSVLNLPLTIVGKDMPIDTITLNEFAGDKLLVIDFWASWCAPCINSMQKWEEIQDLLPDQVVLLGVHMDYAFKARPFIVDREWKSYSAIGLNAYVMNRHFFYHDVISRLVFIKNNRVLKISGTSGYDLSDVKRFLAGDLTAIQSAFDWTYSEGRSCNESS